MSSIDERVVELQFNNGQFESGVQQSLGTLDKLKNALNLGGAVNGLKGLGNAGKSVGNAGLGNISGALDAVTNKFSLFGTIGDQVLRRLTDSAISLGKNILTAIPNQIIEGGKRRSQNISNAQFQLEGLMKEAYDWKKISEDISYAVQDTAYGFDEAALAASQYYASGIKFGDQMKESLRAISGVAAMTNSSYSDTARVFTTVAGQGRLMGDQLNQLAARGLNVAATLGESMGKSEEEIRKMVSKGKIDFETFAHAMDKAFGPHAKEAEKTFNGALANMKASLSRMGEQFATPAYEALRRIFIGVKGVFKEIEQLIKPLSGAFTVLTEAVTVFAENGLKRVQEYLHSLIPEDLTDRIASMQDSLRKFFGLNKEQGTVQSKVVDAAGKVVDLSKKTFMTGGQLVQGILFGSEEAQEALDDLKGKAQATNDVIQRVINGEYGNGEERRKKLEAEGYSYEEIQNGVNEILGVSKRWEVTQEKNAELAKEVEESTEGTQKSVEQTRFDKLTNGLNGIKAALNIIKSAGSSIYNNLLKPFAVWSAPKILDGALTAFSMLGNALTSLDSWSTKNNFFDGLTSRIADFGSTAVSKIGTFLSIVGKLEGVRNLEAALGRLWNTIKEFAGNTIDKVKDAFDSFMGDTKGFDIRGLSEVYRVISLVTDAIANLINTTLDGKNPVANFFGNLTKGLTSILGGNLKAGLGGIGKAIGGLFKSNKQDPIGPVFKAVESTGGKIIPILSKLAGAFKNFGKAVDDAIGGVNLRNLINIFGGASLAKVFLNFKLISDDFTKNIMGSGLVFKMRSVVTTLIGVKSVLQGFQEDLRADALKRLAIAIAILAGAIAVLALLDHDKMIGAVGALGILISETVAALAALNKMNLIGSMSAKDTLKLGGISAALILFATAMLILSGAVVKMASLSWDELGRGLAGTIVLIVGLVSAANSIETKSKGMLKAATSLIVLSVAVRILSGAVISLSTLSWEQLAKGLIGVIAMIFSLVAAASLLDTKGKAMVKAAISMVLMGSAVKILSSAVLTMATLSWDELGRGLAGMAASLLMLVITLNMLPKDTFGKAMGLTSIASAMLGLAVVLATIGAMKPEELSKGLMGLGAVLLELMIALNAMQGGLKGAAAMLVAAAAIAIMAPALRILGSLSLTGAAVALGVIAGAFVILGIAAKVLFPLIPAIIGLAASFALIGAGAFLAGAGLALLAAGLAGVAASGAVALGMIPEIIGSILTGIIENTENIGNALVSLINAALDAIDKTLDNIIETGVNIVKHIIEGLDKTITEIGGPAVDLILHFIGVISDKIGDIVDAGVDLAVNFINGVADGLREHTDDLLAALKNLISAMIEFMLATLAEIVSMIPVIGPQIAEEINGARETVREFLTSDAGKEDSSAYGDGLAEGIEEKQPKIKEAGVEARKSLYEGLSQGSEGKTNIFGDVLDNGLAGMSNALNKADKAGEQLGSRATKGLESASKKASDEGKNFTEGYANGIETSVSTVEENVEVVGHKSLESLERQIRAHSPSEATKEIGEYFDAGYALGITSKINVVKSAVTSVALASLAAIAAKVPLFKPYGVSAGTYYALGILSKKSAATAAGSSIASASVDGAKSKNASAKGAGIGLGDKIVDGIKSREDAAYKAGARLAEKAIQGFKDKWKKNDPTKDLSNIAPTGNSPGVVRASKDAYSAGSKIGSGAVEGLKKAVEIAKDILEDGIDINPTITPVLDLSQIQNGVGALNGLISPSTVNLGRLNASINASRGSDDKVIDAINSLKAGMKPTGDTYIIEGITYDDGSNVSDAVRTLVTAARKKRRA